MTLPLVTTAAVVVTATGSVLVTAAPEVAAAAKVTVKYVLVYLSLMIDRYLLLMVSEMAQEHPTNSSHFDQHS